MTPALHQLIDSLRNEVQQYGELLAQIEAQQGLIWQEEAGSVLGSMVRLEAQGAALQAARASRDQAQRRLAWTLVQTETGALEELLPSIPGEYVPLLTALSEEVTQLLDRARERAIRNYEQLRGSLDFMQRLLANLSTEASSVRPPAESHPFRTEQPPPLAAAPV